MSTTLRIGDMTVHRLVESEAPFRPAMTFLPDLSPERLDENRGWMREAGALDAEDNLLFCFQSYLVQTPHHTVLIDGCVGNDKERPNFPQWSGMSGTRWMDALAAAGLGVEDVDYVMCTHLHVDHVGWNTRLVDGRWVPTFPNARYLFSATELEFWTAQHAKTPLPHIADSVLPIVAARRADLVSSSHVLGDHIRLLPTPGHTIDHFAVALGRGRAEAVVTGDLIHSPIQARYPEINMASEFDRVQAAATRQRFLAEQHEAGTLCCFMHFPSPSVGRLSRWGDGFRCEGLG